MPITVVASLSAVIIYLLHDLLHERAMIFGQRRRRASSCVFDAVRKEREELDPPTQLRPPSKSQSSVKYLDPPVPSTSSLLVVWE
jgi:hypothetical protein